MTEPGKNLALALEFWGEMSRAQTTAPLVGVMAEDVVWQGLLPELVCRGRDEVVGRLGTAFGGRLPRVTRFDAEEVGERVVITLDGPDFGPGPAGSALEQDGGPRTLALLFEDGKIVRMESFASRQEALSAAS